VQQTYGVVHHAAARSAARTETDAVGGEAPRDGARNHEARQRLQLGASEAPQTAEDVATLAVEIASGAPPVQLLIDGGEPAPGQMTKPQFIALLQPAIVGVVEQELGKLGAAAGCPYIERYFGKYSAEPASAAESLIRHWIPAARGARTAPELVPLILVRVRDAVRGWHASGRLPPDLAAADPDAAADAAHPSSLAGLEAQLGTGSRVDARVASRMSGTLGTDVTDARVHTGAVAAAKAAEHNAAAFAVGGNIVMGANAPAPGTLAGDALLAHARIEANALAGQGDQLVGRGGRGRRPGDARETPAPSARAAGSAPS
jgi:hypothetical protein